MRILTNDVFGVYCTRLSLRFIVRSWIVISLFLLVFCGALELPLHPSSTEQTQ